MDGLGCSMANRVNNKAVRSSRLKLKIQIAQLNFLVGDIEGNTRKIIDLAQSGQGTSDAIVFPELAVTGYPLRRST